MASLGKSLIETITSPEPALRDRSVRALTEGRSVAEKLQACEELEQFRQSAGNLYERVRASLFLQALYRYEIQEDPSIRWAGLIPFDGFMDLMERRYEQAITAFRRVKNQKGPDGAICSALAQAYDQIAFQTLADQVRRSVRSCQGNRWMFRIGGVSEHPLRIHPRLLARESEDALFPILVERTPVRLDLSHSAWSDIFFLGMDYRGGPGAEYLRRPGCAWPRRPSDAADRVPRSGHRRAALAANQYRSGGMQGRRDAGRAVQLRQRL